jgi:Flp pilus assembly pilin Flp
MITHPRTYPLNLKSKRGQTLVEYALILAVVAALAIGALTAMGGQVKGVVTTVTSQMASTSTSSGSGSSSTGGPGHGGGG